MIRVYTAHSCSSSHKVKQWLQDNHIPYLEKNIFQSTLLPQEVKELLKRSENGTDDIISKRSKIIKASQIDFDNMSTSELVAFIQENPTVLKRPIMIDNKRFQIGYHPEEIRTFIPRKLRKDTVLQDWNIYFGNDEIAK